MLHVPPQGQVVKQIPNKQQEVEHCWHEFPEPSMPLGHPLLPEHEFPWTPEQRGSDNGTTVLTEQQLLQL